MTMEVVIEVTAYEKNAFPGAPLDHCHFRWTGPQKQTTLLTSTPSTPSNPQIFGLSVRGGARIDGPHI